MPQEKKWEDDEQCWQPKCQVEIEQTLREGVIWLGCLPPAHCREGGVWELPCGKLVLRP